MEKLEKIAAAKKKLKQFQSKPKVKEINTEKPQENEKPQNVQVSAQLQHDNMETGSQIENVQNDIKTESEPPKNVELQSFFNFNTVNMNNQIENVQSGSEFNLKNYFTTDSSIVDFLSEPTLTPPTTSQQIVEEIDPRPPNEEIKPITYFSNPYNMEGNFNILPMPENNSPETISTISERTENTNESSYMANDLVELRTDVQDDNISNTDSLNKLSAHMTSIILTEDTFDKMNPTPGTLFELEQKNQELSCLYQTEKIKNDDLRFKVENQGSLIEELSFEVQKLQLEKSTRLDVEANTSLQEQLQSHIHTVGILVGEKSELTASLTKTQQLYKEKSIETDELHSRLNASRHKVQELEKEMSQLRLSCDKLNGTQQKLCTEIENSQEEIKRINLLYNESAEEIVALNQKLNIKGKEIINLQTEIKQKSSELNMCHLRIEQLASGETDNSESQIIALTGQKDTYEQQVNEYQLLTEQLRTEKEQANQQYQNYVQHLNREVSNLSIKVNELNNERDRLAKREEELIKHIGELEKQLQITMNATKNNEVIKIETVRDEKMEEEIKSLTEKIVKLEMERESVLKQNNNSQDVQQQLMEKIEKIQQLELTIERLQMNRPDTANLMATLESDKIAASRAVSQNQDLKYQLEEMQKAFVQISNDKLELTDRLQTEQHLCREMKIHFTEMETELTSLRGKFDNKDDEMIRLAHENSELNKNILQQSQELDRLRHYEAGNHLGNMLQIELQNANEQVSLLRSRVKEFEQERVKNHVTNNGNDENSDLTDICHEIKEGENHHHSDDQSDIMSSSTFMIASHEAMEKLQERFRRTMDEIADLTEEKQKLEHLVMQLQGETETIGEYVTLYQYQRRLLKQREIEKDVELQKLASDREQMKDKLLYLNSLIEELLHEKGVKSDQILQNLKNNNLNGEISIISPPTSNDEQLQLNETKAWEHKKSETQTAVKILNLLSEIKTVNSSMDHLQHCPCCSGKLETV